MRQLKTKEEFDTAIVQDALVVIDFTAEWCGPCQALAPKIEALAKEMPDVFFFKVDVDENEDTAEEYEVSAMPTFLYFVGGKLKATTTGADQAKIEFEIARWRPASADAIDGKAESADVKAATAPAEHPGAPHATATGSAPAVPQAAVGRATSLQLFLKQFTCCA